MIVTGPCSAARLAANELDRINEQTDFTVGVTLEDEETNQAVDASFREKYSDSEYAVTMSTEPVRRNTLEVVPEG